MPSDSVTRPVAAEQDMNIPLQTWSVDAQAFIAQLNGARAGSHTGGATTKAATDVATVYRPINVCRLVDTRAGQAAALPIKGTRGPGSSTLVNSAGICGIPNNATVAGISLSFHVLNHTVNSGGFISFLQQDVPTPPNVVNAVFNEGSVWTAATANVSIPNDTGDFKIYVANATVDVIVDVNGYYQDLDSLDVGTQSLDITGATTTDALFQLTNAGAGSALAASNTAAGINPALTILGGSVNADGAGVNTPTFAFIHKVTAASLCGGDSTLSVINNAQLNGDSGAIALLTPRSNPNDACVDAAAATPLIVFRTAISCTNSIPANRWFVRTPGTALVTNSCYNVLVIRN